MIGDTVNTASRIEGLTKETPHAVLLAEGTYDLAPVDRRARLRRRVRDPWTPLPDQGLGSPRNGAGALMGDKKKKAGGDEKALKRRVRELEAQAQVDTALYRIAQAASAVTDMQEFYAAMHGIVGELMDAQQLLHRPLRRRTPDDQLPLLRGRGRPRRSRTRTCGNRSGSGNASGARPPTSSGPEAVARGSARDSRAERRRRVGAPRRDGAGLARRPAEVGGADARRRRRADVHAGQAADPEPTWTS